MNFDLSKVRSPAQRAIDHPIHIPRRKLDLSGKGVNGYGDDWTIRQEPTTVFPTPSPSPLLPFGVVCNWTSELGIYEMGVGGGEGEINSSNNYILDVTVAGQVNVIMAAFGGKFGSGEVTWLLEILVADTVVFSVGPSSQDVADPIILPPGLLFGRTKFQLQVSFPTIVVHEAFGILIQAYRTV